MGDKLRHVWRWLLASPDPVGTVLAGWNAVKADQAYSQTERYLLGWAGPMRKVRDEAAIQAREQRIGGRG